MPQTLVQTSFRLRWQSYRHVPSTRLPRHWQRWLLDRGSLTQRLIDASGGDFRVEVRFQGWARPSRSEARALAIPSREVALIREVRLIGRNQPWVSARSVIPASTLCGPQRKLRHLGNRSLGSLLFRDPTLVRSAIETCRIRDAEAGNIWARRSVFLLGGKPLLVSELFHPPLATIRHPKPL